MLLCRVSKAASSSVSTSFKEGQLHFFAAFYRPAHTDKHRTRTFPLSFPAVFKHARIFPKAHIHNKKCTHLKYFATYVPVTALTPDPKLTVVVSLTVRYPISEQ